MMTNIIKLMVLESKLPKRLLSYSALLGEEPVDLSRPKWKKLLLNSNQKVLKSFSVMVITMKKPTKVCSLVPVSCPLTTPKWTDSKLNSSSVTGLGWLFLTTMVLTTESMVKLFSKNSTLKVLLGSDSDQIQILRDTR